MKLGYLPWNSANAAAQHLDEVGVRDDRAELTYRDFDAWVEAFAEQLVQFSAGKFFDQIERLRPTYFSAVPTIYAVLAALPEEVKPDTSSLRFVICGAAPVSEELLRKSQERYGFKMVEATGSPRALAPPRATPSTGCASSAPSDRPFLDRRSASCARTGRSRPPARSARCWSRGRP